MGIDKEKKILYNRCEIEAATANIVDAIISEFTQAALQEMGIIGIQHRGVQVANRIAKLIKDKTGVSPLIGTIDISMYRDDIGLRKALPAIKETIIPFDINGRNIILADDVLHTGRTIRAALDAITDFGRPSLIRLAVLADRGLREFPIRADYIGHICDTAQNKKVKVYLYETDGEDAIYEVKL